MNLSNIIGYFEGVNMSVIVPQTPTQPGFVYEDTARMHHGHHTTVIKEKHDHAFAAAHEVRDSVDSLRGAVDRDFIATTQAVNDGLIATGQNFVSTTQTMGAGFADVRVNSALQAGDIRRDILAEGQALKLLVADRFSALDKDLCAKFDNVTRDTLNGFKDTQIQSLTQAKDAQFFAAQNAAAAALAAATNTAAILAAQAACCCELKELINSKEEAQLRDRLALANQSLLLAKINPIP